MYLWGACWTFLLYFIMWHDDSRLTDPDVINRKNNACGTAWQFCIPEYARTCVLTSQYKLTVASPGDMAECESAGPWSLPVPDQNSWIATQQEFSQWGRSYSPIPSALEAQCASILPLQLNWELWSWTEIQSIQIVSSTAAAIFSSTFQGFCVKVMGRRKRMSGGEIMRCSTGDDNLHLLSSLAVVSTITSFCPANLDLQPEI